MSWRGTIAGVAYMVMGTLIGLPVAYLGLRVLYREWRMFSRGVYTDATVVGVRHDSGDGGPGDYFAQLRFVTADGTQVVAESMYGTPSYARFRPGSQQKIVYDRRRPDKVAMVWMRGRGLVYGFVLLGIGTLAVLIGFVAMKVFG